MQTNWLIRCRDSWVNSLKGLQPAFSSCPYFLLFLVVALLFAFILTINKDGTTNWALLFSGISVGDKLELSQQLLERVFLDVATLGGLLILIISLLQGVAVAMLVYTFKQTKQLDEKSIWQSGVATVLAIGFAGCPACGTALIIPLLSIVFAGSAGLVFNQISVIVSVLTILLLIFAVHRLGHICYIKQRGICDVKSQNK